MPLRLPNGTIATINDQNFKFVPLKAGMRTYAGRHFFYGGEIGLLLALNTRYYQKEVGADGISFKGNYGNPPKAFIYAAGVGYSFDNGLEAGAKFEAYTGTGLKQGAIRLGYRFKLH